MRSIKILMALLMAALVFNGFIPSGHCAGPFAGRILPTKQISFYQDGQKVAQYTAEAPLPWNTLVRCEGQTAVRLDQMYFVLEDGSAFTMAADNGGQTLNIETGTAFFAIKELPEGLGFATPQASVVTEMILLNAANGQDGFLKGYVKADQNGSELGVIEGGRMVVRTATGSQTINAGERIILAQADLGGIEDEDDDDKAAGAAVGAGGGATIGAATATGSGGGAAAAGMIGGGAATAGALVGVTAVGFMASAGSSSGGEEASAFTPPQ